ncbi:hypothetical protein [Gottfriedia acidiceleris]|uniref:hypothetical protein n=1 Tax=Gottfriedia acidiceleris TaxID=371036 RepID=UPI003D214946
MKKFIVAISFLLLTACTNGNSTLNKLKEDYPTLKKEVEKLPKDVQNEIVVPKELPFDVKTVSLEVGENMENHTYDHTSIKYTDGNGTILYITTFHNKNTAFNGDDQEHKTTKLKDGTKVNIIKDKDSPKEIRWKKDGFYHDITLIKLPNAETKYTINDLVKTADSIDE